MMIRCKKKKSVTDAQMQLLVITVNVNVNVTLGHVITSNIDKAIIIENLFISEAYFTDLFLLIYMYICIVGMDKELNPIVFVVCNETTMS